LEKAPSIPYCCRRILPPPGPSTTNGWDCGGGTQLSETKSTTGTADTQTQASWFVKDVVAEAAELRSRGVEVEECDLLGLKTEDGVADIGFALAAWIVDPGKNALGILQIKE
jgi:hypothetical protein